MAVGFIPLNSASPCNGVSFTEASTNFVATVMLSRCRYSCRHTALCSPWWLSTYRNLCIFKIQTINMASSFNAE